MASEDVLVDMDTGNGAADYHDLDEALTDLSPNTYSGGDTVIIRCKDGTGSTPDTTAPQAISAGNWANPPDSITIKAEAGDEAGSAWDATKYILKTISSFQRLLDVRTAPADIYIQRLQIQCNTASSTCIDALDQGSGRRIEVTGNHIYDTSTGYSAVSLHGASAASGSESFAVNNVINGFTNGLLVEGFQTNGNVFLFNNTVANCTTGINCSSNWGTKREVYNNLLIDNTTDYSAAQAASATATNASSDATSPDASFRSLTINFDGSTDFALTDNGGTDDNEDVINAGTDLDADSDYAVTVDIDGTARHATAPTIGAFEYVATGATYEITGTIGAIGQVTATTAKVSSLSGDVAAIGQITGNATLEQLLAANIDCIGQITGQVDTGTIYTLAAAINAIAGLGGNTSSVQGLYSDINGVGNIDADTKQAASLAATMGTVGAINGDTAQVASLAATMGAIGEINGNMALVQALAASIGAIGQITGQVDTGTVYSLAATISAISAISGDTSTIQALHADIDGIAAITGNVGITASLIATMGATGNIDVGIVVTMDMGATVDSVADIDGTLFSFVASDVYGMTITALEVAPALTGGITITGTLQTDSITIEKAVGIENLNIN